MAVHPAPRYPTRSVVRRVLQRAAWEHTHGRGSHAAWQIISDAGLAHHYPVFLRAALRQARSKYVQAIDQVINEPTAI